MRENHSPRRGHRDLLDGRLMPYPFTGPKIFCAGPNLDLVPLQKLLPAQKPILLNANHPFVLHKMFETATICK